MFRLGTVLVIRGYITVTLYHIFPKTDTEHVHINLDYSPHALISPAMHIGPSGTPTRYSDMRLFILLNYTPLIGIGQSIISFAHCLCPILGGYS